MREGFQPWWPEPFAFYVVLISPQKKDSLSVCLGLSLFTFSSNHWTRTCNSFNRKIFRAE